jgi:hypothetical protein
MIIGPRAMFSRKLCCYVLRLCMDMWPNRVESHAMFRGRWVPNCLIPSFLIVFFLIIAESIFGVLFTFSFFSLFFSSPKSSPSTLLRCALQFEMSLVTIARNGV